MTTIDAGDIRLLTEVGFLAAARGDVKHAEIIFGALEVVRPHNNFPYVGLGVAYLNAGHADKAVQTLARGVGLIDAQDAEELVAFHALALQLAGRTSESQRALLAAGSSRLALAMQGRSTMNTQEN